MKKVATLISQCLLVGGMIYSIAVLTATPARAVACNCSQIAAVAGGFCYRMGHAESDDATLNSDGGTLLSCNSTSWTIECEDGYILEGGCQ